MIVRFFLTLHLFSNIVRNDCNRHGGGVACLFSSRVQLVVLPDLCEDHVESIWVEVFLRLKGPCCFVASFAFLISFWLNVNQVFCSVCRLLYM